MPRLRDELIRETQQAIERAGNVTDALIFVTADLHTSAADGKWWAFLNTGPHVLTPAQEEKLLNRLERRGIEVDKQTDPTSLRWD